VKRSPWFNAQRDPPVNGGPTAIYEHRCLGRHYWRAASRDYAQFIVRVACSGCEWRGVLREGQK
jgi:hypothetical protein